MIIYFKNVFCKKSFANIENYLFESKYPIMNFYL